MLYYCHYHYTYTYICGLLSESQSGKVGPALGNFELSKDMFTSIGACILVYI